MEESQKKDAGENYDFNTDTKEWIDKSTQLKEKIIPLLDGLTTNQIKMLLKGIKLTITHSTPIRLV